jgi:hypothetical protein
MMTGLMPSLNLIRRVLGTLLPGSPVNITQPANTVNLLFLGDSLTEGVPRANGETETYPYMTAQQLPGEAGDFLTAAAGRNFRAHNCVSAFVGISWMIFPAGAALFSKGD